MCISQAKSLSLCPVVLVTPCPAPQEKKRHHHITCERRTERSAPVMEKCEFPLFMPSPQAFCLFILVTLLCQATQDHSWNSIQV